MDPIEGPWSPEDDEMLINLILKHGFSWLQIGNSIPGKSVQACSSRFSSLFGKYGVMDQTAGRWSPEEDEMLLSLISEHGFRWLQIGNSIPGKSVETCLSRLLSLVFQDGLMDQIAGRWSPEEEEMLLNLVEIHGYNWSPISKSIPGKSPAKCWSRWRSLTKNDTDQIERLWSSEEDEIDEDEIEMLPKLVVKHGPNSSPPAVAQLLIGRAYDVILNDWNSSLKGKSSSMTNEDITILDHDIFTVQPPPVSDINRGQMNSYSHDLTLRLALGGVSDQAPSNGDMAMETGSQNSIYEGNSSHEVGGMVTGQPPSVSDMARGNMSSGGTHSYSRDHSAPSWNALYKRDSSPMMIDSDSVQQFVGSEFGRKDFSEVSSKA